MGSFADDLPSRFPVGTRYVVEGRGGGRGRLRIRLRYLEFPDGRHIQLPVDLGAPDALVPPPPFERAGHGAKIIRAQELRACLRV
jgi:hypothetical protein